MSKLALVVFSLLGLISACVGQSASIVQAGQCETVTVVSSFQPASFAGVWYDIEALPSPQQTGTCNIATYTLGTGGAFTIQNTQAVNHILQIATGTATPVTSQPAGTYNVQIGTGTTSVPFLVLDTDYTSFALVYSCVNEGTSSRRINSWKLGRQKGPLPAAAITRINAIVSNNQALNTATIQNQFITRNHTAEGCNYYVHLPGQCDRSLTGVTTFNADAFVGDWYEFARYRHSSQTGQCNRATYGIGSNGIVNVQNRQVLNEALNTVSGVAVALSSRPGVLQVNLNTASGIQTQEVVVLATDHLNYALLYSCENLTPTTKRVSSWQLRKSLAPLDPSLITLINNAITANNDLQSIHYQETSQSNAACFYYPDWPTLPSTIDLPGPCESTPITGAANFNAATFPGTWYEHARYPQPTQTGQCNRAVYTAGTGGITVQNSQVTAETLSTISGQAAVVAGQNGLLRVTLTTSSGPITRDIYVLATDNTNYALLYTCQNIEGNMRRVGSWKMSKNSGGLSDAANTAINAVVTSTQGLRQSYYQTTSQTDAVCFYYPPLNPLESGTIDLPGSCNASVSGVAGFNTERFLGTWYEIARYPQPTQTGQCNRATYTAGTGGITVLNSQVIGEALSTISGQATAVAGQSGVFQVTLTTSTGPVVQTLYVLSTDYDNYALLYSCSNLPNNMRRVGSWQMRKHLGPLNAESNNAINTVIQSTQGLRESYYVPTSQSDAACFYYPTWTTLPSTIDLPGPCNTSINGAANFNLQTFAGTWLEFARFPQPTQTGQCNRATYTAGTGGAITVQNSQVITETLSTISGQATAVPGQNGVLQVTLTTSAGPVHQTLYVLATDNTNYALLYSCENIAGNNRRVGSWKMSKNSAGLSEAANTAINAVVTSTQGLLEPYYQTTAQTPAVCFHYPVTQTGEHVIIPGQCDATLSGHANVNLTRLADTNWYHIQRYDQVGNRSCIGTRLTLAQENEQNFLNVYNVELAANVENRTEGIARLTAAVNGQFSLVWSGLEATTVVTLMATDYDSYAIVYSCQNSDINNRRVGVWLLSRTRTWPTAGATALTALVNTRQEFTQRDGYFKAIPQNDECPEPSSAFLFKSSIIVIFVCTILQLVW